MSRALRQVAWVRLDDADLPALLAQFCRQLLGSEESIEALPLPALRKRLLALVI